MNPYDLRTPEEKLLDKKFDEHMDSDHQCWPGCPFWRGEGQE